MMQPDSRSCQALEYSVSDWARWQRALAEVDALGERELKSLCGKLLEQTMLVHPAAVRFLVRQAAGSMSGKVGMAAGERLVESMVADGLMEQPPQDNEPQGGCEVGQE